MEPMTTLMLAGSAILGVVLILMVLKMRGVRLFSRAPPPPPPPTSNPSGANNQDPKTLEQFKEYGPDATGRTRLNPFPIRAHPVVIQIVLLITSIISYMIISIFAIVFQSPMMLFLGGIIAIMFMALPIFRNTKFRKVGSEGIRAVPPHPGIISYAVAHPRVPHELIWIVDNSGKAHEFITPSGTRLAEIAGGQYPLRPPNMPTGYGLHMLSPEGMPIHLFFQSVPAEACDPVFNQKLVDGTLRALQEYSLLADPLTGDYQAWAGNGKAKKSDVGDDIDDATKADFVESLKKYLPIDPRWLVPFVRTAEEQKAISDLYAMAEHGLAKQIRKSQKLILTLLAATFPMFLGATILVATIKG